MGKNASGKKKKGSCQNFCSTVVLLGRTDKNPLVWRRWHYFCHPIFCPSVNSLQKSFLVNVGELFEHATAKKDDGESIIN